MADETITLPCGAVMQHNPEAVACREAYMIGDAFGLSLQRDGRWFASDWMGGDGEEGTRAKCIAWLNARVLALRAALLPPGTIVVRDDPETREAVARGVVVGEKAMNLDCNCGDDGAGPCSACQEREGYIADAVLAALRERAR